MRKISKTAQKVCPQIRIFNQKYIQQIHQCEASKHSVQY